MNTYIKPVVLENGDAIESVYASSPIGSGNKVDYRMVAWWLDHDTGTISSMGIALYFEGTISKGQNGNSVLPRSCVLTFHFTSTTKTYYGCGTDTASYDTLSLGTNCDAKGSAAATHNGNSVTITIYGPWNNSGDNVYVSLDNMIFYGSETERAKNNNNYGAYWESQTHKGETDGAMTVGYAEKGDSDANFDIIVDSCVFTFS